MYTAAEIQRKTTPFYLLDTMYDECATMIQRDDGAINARTLFVPDAILSVYDTYHQKRFTEGKDYHWHPGTNILEWLDGSEIAYFTQNDLHGRDTDGVYIPAWGETAAGWTNEKPWDSLGRSRFGDGLYCIGSFLYERQITVTYTHSGKWSGTTIPAQRDKLLRLTQKLQAAEPLKVVFYGDSIFTGCDASSMYDREPHLPYFPNLVCDRLTRQYGSVITLRNPSVGGMDSSWGAANAEQLAAAEHPDLVVIGFGMNDGGKTGEAVAANVQTIINTVRQASPACEFIVVSPMNPNRDTGFYLTHNQLSSAFAALSQPGIAFVDVFTLHEDILKTKDFSSTSGNNVNHPNDWLICIYAQSILAAIG